MLVEFDPLNRNHHKNNNDSSNNSNNGLVIGLLNIRSLKNKLHELETFIKEQTKPPKIFIITETWLKQNEVKFYNINNYQTIANCRETSRDGGVLMFIHNSIKFNLISSEHFDKSHILSIQLTDKKLKICGFYRSQKTDINSFFERLDLLLEKNQNMICFGDANFNLLTPNEKFTQYLEILENNNFRILNEITNEQFTYSENNYKSILDHIITDSVNINKFNISILDVCFSDHRYLNFECDISTKSNEIKSTKLKIDYDKIEDDLKLFDFVKMNYTKYTTYRNNTLKKHTTIKTNSKRKANKQIWMDKELRRELDTRKKLFKIKKKKSL